MIGRNNISRPPLVQKQRSVVKSLPAPTGGWNVRDNIASMPEKDAVSLVNLFPDADTVALRAGFTQHATGLPAQVETLMSYQGGATSKLFAISNGAIYDVTSSGAVGAAAVSSLTNSRWQYINISTAGGSFIELCNGADGVYTYDGSSWTDQSGSITGVTASNLININLFKNRVWFIEEDTLRAWYLPTQSITGAAAALDLRAFCRHGGYLMAMGTWTVDAGYGVDDHAVFVTSEGEVLVYRGTDPSSASTWALVGVWWIGSPIGRRCLVKYQGELLIICQDGLFPLSGALQSSRTNPRVALTDKINKEMTSSVNLYGSNFGWQVIDHPNKNALLLNVPITAGNGQQQYVMNTITKAWCQFQGWNANCWELFGDELYFGANAYVGKAFSGTTDNSGAIFMDGLQAFNYFGSKGQQKRFTMMRPMLYINSTQSINAGMNVQFDQSAPASAIATASFSGALWDSATWDSGLWSDPLSVSQSWQGAVGVGYCAAPHIQANLNGASLQWLSTDVVMEPGGIL